MSFSQRHCGSVRCILPSIHSFPLYLQHTKALRALVYLRMQRSQFYDFISTGMNMILIFRVADGRDDWPHRNLTSSGISGGRPHCDVCGWTEVSLSLCILYRLEVINLVFPHMILLARALFAVLAYLRDWLTVLAAIQGMYWLFLLFNSQSSNKFASV